MKYKKLLVLTGAISFFIFVSQAHAEIVQGNASSSTSVTTNIQGSGSVHTYIQSTVNGQTQTVEGDKPGTYVLNNSSEGTNSNNKNSVTITISQSPTPTASPSSRPTPQTKVLQASYMNVFSDVRLWFHQAVQDLLSFFHL